LDELDDLDDLDILDDDLIYKSATDRISDSQNIRLATTTSILYLSNLAVPLVNIKARTIFNASMWKYH
jgi:hypothetical protein